MTMDFILTDGAPFAVSFLVMIGIGLVELIGLSFSAANLDFLDADSDGTVDNQLLDWLGVGQVPLSVILVVFLALFTGFGLFIQSIFHFPHFLSIPAAAGASLPLTGVGARILAKVWPQDETTAISMDDLIGKRATIIQGIATKGQSAEARVKDFFNQSHYISIEPHADTQFHPGDEVLIVSREGSLFKGIDPMRAADFRTV